MIRLIRSEPYKLFFLMGSTFSLLGAALWIMFYFGLIAIYPIKIHSQFMLIGFLFSFVSGFLMTAVPKMTGTEAATMKEKIIFSGLLLAALTLSSFGLHQATWAIASFLFLFLFSFFFKRKLKMKQASLPSGFIFIPIGIVSGLVGSTLMFMFDMTDSIFISLGRILLFEGFILNLIVGLGSRLIPILSKKIGAESPLEVRGLSNREFMLEAFALNLSFYIEVFLNDSAGVALRFAAMVYVLFNNFKFHKKAIVASRLGRSISIASVFFPLGYLLILIFPQYRAHFIHILYIAGFALLTFLVSIRVSLAHGGASLELEKSSISIDLLTLAFLLSMLVRSFGYIAFAEQSILLLAIASLFFILGAVAWAVFLLKSLASGSDENRQC